MSSKISMLSVVLTVLLGSAVVLAGKSEKYNSLRYELPLSPYADKLQWDVMGNKIRFQITAPGRPAMIALGFSETGTAYESDFIIFYRDLETQDWTAQDAWSDFYGRLSGDHTQSYKVHQIKHIADTTVVRFERDINTCDLDDYRIDSGTTHLLYTASGNFSGLEGLDLESVPFYGNKVQLLKSQMDTPLTTLGAQVVQVRNPRVEIPGDPTTYWCSTHRLPNLPRKQHVIKFEGVLSPDSIGIVHHMEVFHCETVRGRVPFYNGPCDQKPEKLSACSKVLAAWAVGASPFSFPSEAGFPIGGRRYNRYVMLQTHFNNPDGLTGIVDLSGIALTVTNQLRQYDAAVMELGVTYDARLSVPPKMESFYWDGICTPDCTYAGFPPDGIIVFASQLHTHLAGKQVKTLHFRDGEYMGTLNEDRHYSSNFQEIRLLRQKVHVLPGDLLVTECKYETMDRTNVTLGGMGTGNEMCVNYIYYYPRSSLEVCKSSLSTLQLDRFFSMMTYYLGMETSASHTVAQNFDCILWNPMATRLLQWFYDTQKIEQKCMASDGTSFEGRWDSLSRPAVWYKDDSFEDCT